MQNDNSSCNLCGAHIKWFQNSKGTWLPFNIEDMDDDFDPHTAPTHWKTCKREKPPIENLSYEKRTRPGYL